MKRFILQLVQTLITHLCLCMQAQRMSVFSIESSGYSAVSKL